MKNAIMSALIAAALCSGATVANAAAYQGVVQNVYAWYGKVVVLVGGGAFDGPSGSCPWPDGRMGYLIDVSTDYGKAVLAIVLQAKATGALVWAAGSGPCQAGPGASVETLAVLDLKG